MFDNGCDLGEFKNVFSKCDDLKQFFDINTGLFTYSEKQFSITYNKMLKLVNDFNYIASVETGYEVGKRRAYAASLNNKTR